MKQHFARSIIGAALIAFGVTALAQSPTTPADRATVKAEAASVNKTGDKQTGEGRPQAKPMPRSALTRDDVKAETKAAAARGEMKGPAERASPPVKKAMVTKTRQQVKDETKVAKDKGEILPAGEIVAPTKTK